MSTATEVKHTPGPWTAKNSLVTATTRLGFEVTLIDCYGARGWSQTERHANARLVAAAPDLLDAVRMAIPSYQTYGEDSYDRLLALCRAYKKATGERHPADRWTGDSGRPMNSFGQGTLVERVLDFLDSKGSAGVSPGEARLKRIGASF